ncbi:hypothetical protein GIB67_006150 [Kingdonia uniflora]|uniref:FAR1 domain-containing protein n=1 Tax=Kingdonia uniflora TaxID=39325 RepID=A0A7J7LQ36_9MAGN|nr:hypothetical protein GIB67_006150 [Kingdonia uniflora]
MSNSQSSDEDMPSSSSSEDMSSSSVDMSSNNFDYEIDESDYETDETLKHTFGSDYKHDEGKEEIQEVPHLASALDTNMHKETLHEGMTFESEEKSYEKYNEFARCADFSVRKGKTYKRSNGTVRCQLFVCFKEGFKGKDPRHPNPKINNK